MLRFKLARPILVALAACAAGSTIGSAAFADDAQDNAQLKEQMRIMMQQMQELQRQGQDLRRQEQAVPTPPAAPPSGAPPAVGAKVAQGEGPAAPAAATSEPKFEKFLKGFYGT